MQRRDLCSAAVVALLPGCLSGPGGFEERTAEAYLPESGDGWRLEETTDPGLGKTGLEDAAVGKYRSPDDVRYDAVVIFSGSAGRLLDAGWQVAVPIDEGAMAVSTGREGPSPTPEHPPRPSIEGTPIPESHDRALELLARSPELTEKAVESNCRPC